MRAYQTTESGPQDGREVIGVGAYPSLLSRLAVLCFCTAAFAAGILIPAQGQTAETWRILAVRVSFPQESPDGETTSGDGGFDLRPFADAQEAYRFPFDIPPHDRSYFEAHLQALANYYRTVSQGQLEIDYEVYPRDPAASYVLSTPLKDYGNGRSRQEIDERITRLFRDGIAAADSAEGENLDFSQFQAFAVFHAGLGGESSQALNDIPSAFVSAADLDHYAGGPIPVDGGARTVGGGMLLPEATSADGRGGLNGTLVRFFANLLGLPGLSNFEDDLPAVGDWSLMDTGANNFVSAARLGLPPLTGNSADTVLVGFIPSRMLAWSRIQLGWLIPQTVTHNDTVRIVAPHVVSDLPQAVKLPISADEYFLLENRISRLDLRGRTPHIEFSRGAEGGVWLSVDDYDAFIPGSGLLVWHIDDAVVRAANDGAAVNCNPRYRIATAQYRRGVSLEEADGLEDIGNISSSRIIQGGIVSFSDIEGGPQDPFYAGNNTRFGPDTHPDTRSNLGYPTGITVEILSPPGDTMTVAITFAQQQDAWPVTGLPPIGLQAPRAIDLDGDGVKEIIRSQPPEISSELSAWEIDGRSRGGFHFASAFTPAIGRLPLQDPTINREGIVGSSQSAPLVWLDGDLVVLPPAGGLPSDAHISAPPVVARFSGSGSVDIWGWSHGSIRWGDAVPDSRGTVDLGSFSISSITTGNIDADPANELIALTETGRLFVVENNGASREIASFADPIVGAPVLADLDRDGDDDIAVVTAGGTVSILNADGPVHDSAPVPGGAASSPVLGDLDGDGFVEVLFGGTGRLWGMRFNGVLQTDTPLSFPLKDETGPIEAPPVLADLDGDGSMDILAGSTGGLVYGLRSSGESLPGFPLAAVGAIRTSPLVEDLDGDGTLELVAFTDNGAMHLWHLESVDPSFTGNRVIWGQQGGGPGNAGRLLQNPQADPPDTQSTLLPPDRAYCYPNPIRNASARIRFYLGDAAQIDVTILNAIGEIVDRLSLAEPVARTDNEIPWDTSDYASGLYICRIEAIADGRSEVRFVKAAVIK